MKFHLRVDESNGRHVHCTLFADGANCGKLCLNYVEYNVLGGMMLTGSMHLVPPVDVSIDTAIIGTLTEEASRE